MAPSDKRRSGRPRAEPELGPQVGREQERPPVAPPTAGARLVGFDTAVTAVFVVLAAVATAFPRAATIPLVVLSVAMFALGTAAFLWAYAIAVGRSRHEAIGMGGLFFLLDSAPQSVRRRMLALWGLQIVVAFVAASIRIFSGVAFALLAPMFGIGLLGLWGARHGVFPPRVRPGERDATDE